MHRFMRRLFATGLLASMMLLAACSEVSQKNYNRLGVGMTYDEVVALLGEADECNSALGLKVCRWGDEKKHIDIHFAGSKVAFYAAEGLK